MAITLDLPEDLLEAALAEAAARGLSLDGFVENCLRKELAALPLLSSDEAKYFEIGELGFPVLKKRGATLTSEEVEARLEDPDEEDFRRTISMRKGERS